MKTAAIDFETYYDDKINITVQGSWNYIHHPEFDAYMVTVVTDTGISFVGHPRDFDWGSISGKDWQWLHHNASFDELIINMLREKGVILDSLKPAVTHCTADLAAFCGGPRNLKGASSFFLGEEVSKDTRTAMKGQTWGEMTPEFKKEVSDYALRDSELTLKLWQKLSHEWPDHERALSRHTRMMAWDGIPIDKEGLDASIPKLETQLWEAGQSLPWYVEDDKKPLSPKALAEECRKVGIEPPPSLAKDSEECAAWEDKYGDIYPWVGAMRTFRRSNTLLERLKAMKARVKPDGNMNFGLLYFGATTTGRWSGAEGVNVQNLPAKPMFGVNFRGLLKAPPGYKFINADLSQIEPRCLAWIVQDEAMLTGLRAGMAIYEVHARATMGWTGGKLKDADKDKYALAKARVLSLGYGAGAEKFILMAANYGVTLNFEEADSVVKGFRAASPLVCGRNGLWNQLQVGMERSARSKENYMIELPSGRKLRYFRPSVVAGLTAETNNGRGITRRKWWGGSLTENCLGGNTQVLTLGRGWVRLDSVKIDDLLWDGDSFVPHEGLVCRGIQKVILVAGIEATPDHEFLSDAGWVSAKKACTLPSKVAYSLDEEVHSTLRTPILNGKNNRKLDCATKSPLRREAHLLGDPLYLRGEKPEAGEGVIQEDKEERGGVVQYEMPRIEEPYQESEVNPRDVFTPSLLCLEVNERPLSSSNTSSVEKLRGERDNSVSGVGGVFPNILEGCGALVGAEVATRQDRQLEGLLYRELSLGHSAKELPKYEVEHSPDRVAERLLDVDRRGETQSEHGILPCKSPVELGKDGRGDTVLVYDILNCGLKHRFAARSGACSPILIAHNCIQATARDVFSTAILRIEEELGLPVLFHVHDEITCLVKEEDAESALKDVLRIMCTPPDFMSDLPLNAEGHIVDSYPLK